MKKTSWAKLVNILEVFEFVIRFIMDLSSKFVWFEVKIEVLCNK